MSGPPKKPTRLKALEGNPGGKRLPKNEPTPAAGAKCPQWLDKEGKALWKKLAPELERVGLLTIADGPAFALLCDAWSRYRTASRTVRKEPMVYDSTMGNLVRNPWVDIATRHTDLILKLASHFGMTPSSRAGLEISKEEEVDEFTKWQMRKVQKG